MTSLKEIEARLETTVFAKAGDRAKEYVRYRDVKLLIRAIREFADARPHLYGRVKDGQWIPFDPDVLALIEEKE